MTTDATEESKATFGVSFQREAGKKKGGLYIISFHLFPTFDRLQLSAAIEAPVPALDQRN